MNQVNYQKELEKILNTLQEKGEAASDYRPPRLFLHSCCAPCSSYCLEYLCRYFLITVFYYNPNISFSEEYQKRVAEQKRLIAAFPQDARIPEAKLSLAAALVNLGKKKEATETLKGVQKDYPDTEAAKLAGERLKALTAKPRSGRK